MTKSLTELWKDGELNYGYYYLQTKDGERRVDRTTCDISSVVYSWTQTDKDYIQEVLEPVPSYESLYNPNDGRIPVGLFTVLKIIKRDIERYQKIRYLTDLECGIKSQVVSLLKRRGWDLGKDEPVSNSDELSRKTDQLEKKLDIATKALKKLTRDCNKWEIARKALKEMEGVK